MGFLDKVGKGLGELSNSINQVVNDATSQGAPPPPQQPVSAPTSPGAYQGVADDDFVDGNDPASWLDAQGVARATSGVAGSSTPAFTSPQSFERDDAIVARWVSSDGAFTIDLGSINEDYLGRYQTFDAVVASLESDLVSTQRESGPFDSASSGSTGAGHARYIASLADLVMRADVWAPVDADARAIAYNVLYLAMRFDS